LATNFVCAQPTGVVYNIGPKIGANVYKSRFQFSDDEQVFDQQTKFGFQVGGTIDLPLKEMIHFAAELYYSNKGKKTLITDTGLTNDAKYHFLEAPILLRFTFNAGRVSSGMVKWHLDIGPTISYWLGGKGNLYADGPTVEYKIEFGEVPATSAESNKMYISNANRWQWGLVAGAGVNYPIYKGQVVFIDIRAAFGGTNLGKHDSEAILVPQILGFSDSMNVRFLEFSISAAYTFEIDWVQRFKGKSTDRKRKKS
jgi:hypothetical protein